jgi:hypothetical protein
VIARRILGSLAGVVATTVVILAIESIGHRLTGVPADPAAATPAMKAVVVAAWTIGTYVGALVGVTLARWSGAAWIAAFMVVLGVIATALTLPTPWWMVAGGILLPVAAAALAARRVPAETQRVAL